MGNISTLTNEYVQSMKVKYKDKKDDDVISFVAYLKGTSIAPVLNLTEDEITRERLDLSNQLEKYWIDFQRIESMFYFILNEIAEYNKVVLDFENSTESTNVKFDLSSLNRKLVHILSSGNMFVMFMENYLINEFTNESQCFKEFKKFLSSEYDCHFEYRFMYSLRNYVHHIELPPLVVEVQNHLVETKKRRKVAVFMDSDHLIKSGFKWNAKVSADLNSCSTKLDVSFILERYFYSITRIYGKICEIYLNSNNDKLLTIKSEIEKFDSNHAIVQQCDYTKNNLIYHPEVFTLHPVFGLNEIDQIFIKLGKIGLVNIQNDD